MKTRIIAIGNSQGIRIPKPLLEETGLEGEVDVSVENSCLIVRPATGPRADWDSSFSKMTAHGDDTLLDDAVQFSSWDEQEWQWK